MALIVSESLSVAHRAEISGAEIVITYSPAKLGTAIPHPSLLVTLGCWYSNPLAASQSGDDSNVIGPVSVHIH